MIIATSFVEEAGAAVVPLFYVSFILILSFFGSSHFYSPQNIESKMVFSSDFGKSFAVLFYNVTIWILLIQLAVIGLIIVVKLIS